MQIYLITREKSWRGLTWNFFYKAILNAIFVAQLFDLAKMTKFVDDNFVIKFGCFLPQLLINMKNTLEMKHKWLKDSGLRFNVAKTELCILKKTDVAAATMTINTFKKVKIKSMYLV